VGFLEEKMAKLVTMFGFIMVIVVFMAEAQAGSLPKNEGTFYIVKLKLMEMEMEMENQYLKFQLNEFYLLVLMLKLRA
jgi:hypothetical protein